MRARGDRLPEHIEGYGIELRRWRPSDAQALGQAVSESVEHLRPWMDWVSQEPLTPAARRHLIAAWEDQWAQGGDVLLGVFSQERIVGGCGLHQRLGPRGLEIGYWIHPGFVRQGLATRAAALLTKAAFSIEAIDHVEIHHDKANVASGAVPRKLGFRFVGEKPDEIVAPGEVGIDCLWRMDRDSWSPPAAM